MESVLQEALRFAEGALPWWQYLALVVAVGILLAVGRRVKMPPTPDVKEHLSTPIEIPIQRGPGGDIEITAPIIPLRQEPPKEWL